MASYVKEALKICVAQICQNIGWHAVQASPMDILVDVLQRYLLEISKSVHQYSVQYNRTEPNLDDLGLTFKDFGIPLHQIEEYINNVEAVPFPHKVPSFPIKHPPNLQHPKPESRELLVRPEHIPDYLPLMHPDLEEEEVVFAQQSVVDGAKKNVLETNAGGDSPSPFNSPRHGSKRSGDWPPDATNKKSRYYSEEEGRPMREVTSVFMTPSGFISPVHEGKSADPSLPCLVDSPPPTPELPSHSSSSKKDVKFKDIRKEKSSKPKKDKDINKKDLKKLKASKKEKENKENAVGKHDKLVTSSSSSKKEHTSSSHKSGKSDKSIKSEDSVRQKSKSDKVKLKSRKDEMHKMKDSFKLSKIKAKLKHSGASSSSTMKSSKLASSKKFKSARVPKAIKNLKKENAKLIVPQPAPSLPTTVIPNELPVDLKPAITEPKVEKEVKAEFIETEELSFREESPEPRLVIDDSIETQARQERESRLEVIDECIESVIRQSEVEVEKTHKAMDETINAVVRGPAVKKLEPKDIYDFTDTSDSSSLSSCDLIPHSPIHVPVKKEKKSAESKKSSGSPKRTKGKDKQKKKGGRDSKAKSPTPYASPKNQKSSFMLKVDDRTPSPIPLKDDLLSSEGSTPSPSPQHNTFFDHTPQVQSHIHPPPLLSQIPSMISPFMPMPVSGSGYPQSPFSSMRPLPCHMQTNPHFPTPPLFVTPSKSENSPTFQNIQPLNLAKPGPSTKGSPEKTFESGLISQSSLKPESSDIIKKAANILDKMKTKDHKKEKLKKRGRKEVDKTKDKKEEVKEKEKSKPKEKPKAKEKAEKSVKVDKRKSKPEKKKIKEKEEKVKEDSTVPKMTLKVSGGTGSMTLKLSGGSSSTKIFVNPNSKTSTPLSSSSSPSNVMEDENVPSPSPVARVPTPSPPRVPTPPPPPRLPTPPPPVPSPPPVKEIKEPSPPPVPPPPITTKTTHSRGRGRGKKAAVQAAVPPARTVITETLGTIVDESGNKIWICPACSGADDGSPMIGCDECDDWYHWVCVGIVVPPKEEENWFCVRCIAKRQGPNAKRRKKKYKKEK
ncbi:hypothetical protein X975_13639, partial [Stegodyphus mimosarum]